MREAELPARIGKYELQEFIGGGMSHVYRARDTVIGRTVAIKLLTPAGCADPEAKQRFLAEARMAGNVEHDNVLSIYDFGEDDHRPFIVMEFLRGEDLRHAIQNGRTGDLKQKLNIALQVARALEYVHGQKIIHRDIKPDNVYLTVSGVAKLMDFGIAKSDGLALTRAGFVLGTPSYMAPEQVSGGQTTEQSDVYSYGLLLYELLSGVKPVSGETMERLFYCILHERLNPQPLKQAGIPGSLCELVERCAAKDPAARPQGFAPIVAELERLLGELHPERGREQARAVQPWYARARWLYPAALAAALACLAIYAVIHHPAPRLPNTLSTSTGEMTLVPAGEFLFGEKKERLTLPAFYIDKTEVTNAAYQKFCIATHHALPPGFSAGKPDYPVVNVTILNARDFSAWAGKRLPNSREWEKAARGSDGRTYPWGNNGDSKRANIGTDALAPAMSFGVGASPCGALQMVGNVWEFVEQLSTPGPKALDHFTKHMKPPPEMDEPWYMIRGGSFRDQLTDNIVWDSSTTPARWRAANIGFRCVKER